MKMLRMRDIVAFVVVIAMVVAITPIVAFPAGVSAADEGSISGQFSLGDAAPTVDNVTLYNAAGNTTVTTMTPETEFVVKVTVTDTNSLNDLDFVKVTLYYDVGGGYDSGEVPTSGHQQTCAIITAYNSDNWVTDNCTPDFGTTTRWTFVELTQPADTALSTGTFEFKFGVGAVATMTTGVNRWHIHAEANDGTSATNYQADREMAWFGELTVSGGVTWSSIAPGAGFTIQSGNITENYVSNGAWVIKVAATSPWTASAGNATLVTDNIALTAGEFAIKANDSDNLTTAEYVQNYTTFSSAIQSGTQTTESGDETADNKLWLSIGSPFPNGTYSGTIYYKISNS
jgi:hypothetical protein